MELCCSFVQTYITMAILLQSLRLIDQKSVLPAKDYVFANGKIWTDASTFQGEILQVIDCSGFMGSKGWTDLRCFSAEPGEEHKDTLESLGELLSNSGFTQAVIMPNTHPAIQTKNEVQFLKSKTADWLTTAIIVGAATKQTAGEDFTDMLDLHSEGVQVFGDGLNPIANPDRMVKILQYLQKFEGILFDQSYEPLLAVFGQMHEGLASTRIGMKGIPSISEYLAVQKNLDLLEYAGGRLHIQAVSTKESVAKIKEAKAKGLKVTADVSLYNLLFTDEDLLGFDTNLKVTPPFRSEEDRQALLEGLKDGTIDAIVSNHQPQDLDAKNLEFDLASSGMLGLQTFLPGIAKLAVDLGWPLLMEKITSGPNKVLGHVEEDFSSLTVFDPEETWIYDSRTNLSLSGNSPWLGQELKGKVKIVINKNKFKQF